MERNLQHEELDYHLLPFILHIIKKLKTGQREDCESFQKNEVKNFQNKKRNASFSCSHYSNKCFQNFLRILFLIQTRILFLPPLFNTVMEVLAWIIRQENKIQEIWIEKEVKTSLFVNGMILFTKKHLRNPQENYYN